MEDRLEIWLELLAGKLDRLIELGENVERASRSQEMPVEWGEHEADHFADANKMVGEDPAKEPGPEHPAGPKPDPGEGYRILSKDPPEDLTPNAEWYDGNEDRWCGIFPANATAQHPRVWYRRKIEPAKQPEPSWEPKVGEWVRVTRPENWEKCWNPCWLAEMHQFDGKVGRIERDHGSDFRIRGFVGSDGLQYKFYRDWLSPAKPPKPAWEPKVGDWVRVTRPQNWEECRDPDWLPIMHEYHDKVMQVSSYENRWGAWCAKCDGVGWFFHRDWLTPSIQYFAEPPEIDKPLETEYQRPSLPEDAGKLCEFSDDGESWVKGYLKGFDCDRHWNEGIGWLCGRNFLADRAGHRFARIKKGS